MPACPVPVALAAVDTAAPARNINRMVITLNGEARELAAATSVAGLLAELALDLRKVAVERNEAIVPKSRYDATLLAPGDALEIVHFIGGG